MNNNINNIDNEFKFTIDFSDLNKEIEEWKFRMKIAIALNLLTAAFSLYRGYHKM